MKSLLLVALLTVSSVCAQTQLTIYNQNFAAVKEIRTFELENGENEVRVSDITAHLEPESVMLRDLSRPDSIQILEQNYESDPLSQGLLLLKSEGKVLDFETTVPQTGEKSIVKGKVLRSGYVPHASAFNHKEEAVEVRVVEHMYRWIQWEITAGSMDRTKTDAQTVEFRPTISAGGEATITYTVHYTW